MTQAANFTVNNGAATPVAITFEPEWVSGGNAVFRDDSGGITNLMPRIKINSSLATANRPTNKSVVNVTLPVKKTVDGVDVVDHVLRADVSIVSSDRSTLDSRKDLLAILVNALSEDPIKDSILSNSPMFGG